MNLNNLFEGGPYDLPGIDYPRPGDMPAKPRYRGQQSPGVNPNDEDYFREIFRQKREAAKKAEQDKEQGMSESMDDRLPIDTLDLIDEYIAKIDPDADRNKLINYVVDGSIHTSELEYALQDDVAEGSVEKTPTGLRHHGDFPDYPGNRGSEFQQNPDRLSKSETGRLDKAFGVKWKPTNKRKEIAGDPTGVTEVKKKDNSVKDVALQRAMSKARAAFPTATNDFEALAKDMMQGQDQDQDEFEKIRQADKEQDRLLSQISQIDKNQTQEIDGLEQENNTLKNKLQQIQSMNSRLTNILASMSGRKEKRKTDDPIPTSNTSYSTVPTVPTDTARTVPNAAPEPTTSKAMGQMAKSLSPSVPSAAIAQMSKQLQPRQKELGFDEPVTIKPKKYDTSKAADAQYRELTSKIAKDIVSRPDAARAFNTGAARGVAAQQEMPIENKEQRPERPEADYGDEYQSIVKRMGQKAKEGPRKTVWDPVKRVYKTVPVNK